MRTLSILLFILLIGCKPEADLHDTKTTSPQLHDRYFLTEDGLKLPLHRWLPVSGAVRAVIIGVHGFNDYSYFFRQPAEYFSSQGIACFAYDQRGFGAAPQRGFWAGRETYAADLQGFVQQVKQHYPGIPVYLLGESMGGAVVMAAIRNARMPSVDGVILAAPAVWPRKIMPWYQTSLLWVLSRTVPWLTISGQGVKVKLSDNREMIRELDNDPLVLRKTRVESLYGLTNLMDSAFENADLLSGNILLLYGDRDDIIPKEAIYAFLKRLYSSGTKGKTVGFYPQGYHLLLRDQQAHLLWRDIVAWIASYGSGKLPSGADDVAKKQLLMPLLAWQRGSSR
ncbi:lysophospholipase [Methyloglobulus sp.]|uniref:alpha/beta hydrolase n=1 Tax=Methyloglobulus sp. TaxID=2518622 RepID=UPI0032B85A8E